MMTVTFTESYTSRKSRINSKTI